MNIADELYKEHSKRQTLKIVDWVGNDPLRFSDLIQAFLSDDAVLIQRSAWVISTCVERHPELAMPWLKKMIDRMRQPGLHPAVSRNVLHLLQTTEIPTRLLGIVVTYCFDVLVDPGRPIAVKAFAMTVLANAARRQPDLAHEIEESIRNIPNPSAGIKARARKTFAQLKKLDKIKEG